MEILNFHPCYQVLNPGDSLSRDEAYIMVVQNLKKWGYTDC